MYDFIKNQIWYIIIHQQQIEGLFNKYDLKTHQNMNQELQQSKLRLSIGSNSFENIDKSRIKEVRKQRRNQPLCNLNLKNNINSQDAERVREADQLFDKYFSKKK